MDIRYSYKDVPTIRGFSNCESFIRGLMGPFGSGKSSACVIEIIQKAQEQHPGPDGIRRSRWAVIRNSYPQLNDTTVRTVHQWLPPGLCGTYTQHNHIYKVTNFPGVEIELLFRALDRPDHVKNLLSLELTGAWVNEAREVPWTIIEALQGRVGRYPAVREGGCKWAGIIMDTNPPDVDSRWFKFFEEQGHPEHFAKIFKQPSGLSPDAENLKNLPEDYYERLAMGKEDEWVKVYVKGEYGFVIDGKPVYGDYSDSVHCTINMKLNPKLPIYRGWDFGLTPACIFSQLLPSGQWIIFDELVSENMGIDRFSDEVIPHCAQEYEDFDFIDYGDPAGNDRGQTDERTCFEILQAKGIDIEPGLQTLAIRLESVRKPLRTLVGGRPMFQLHPNCKMLRKGFQGGYQYRRMQTSAERYTNAPDKNAYSHPHDGLQYVATRLFGFGLTTQDRRGKSGYEEDEDNYSSSLGIGRSEVTGY